MEISKVALKLFIDWKKVSNHKAMKSPKIKKMLNMPLKQ